MVVSPTTMRTVTLACLVLSATTIAAQSPSRTGEAALKQAIVAADSARAASPEALAPLVEGLRHSSPAVQQLAVRVLGRRERSSVVPMIAPALNSPSAAVRAEAANALAQAVQGAANHSGVTSVAKILRERLSAETDPAVRGVLYESLGRIAYGSPEEVRGIEVLLVQGSTEAARDRTLTTLLGIMRGFEALYRQHGKKTAAGGTAVERLRTLARTTHEGTEATAAHAARIRQLAVTALQWANATDVATLRAGLEDPDVLVRKVSASFLDSRGNPRYSDDKAQELLPVISDGSHRKDPSFLVRYEIVQAYGRYLRDAGCSPLLEAAGDAHTLVAQAAIDALGRGCPVGETEKVTESLKRIADSLPRDATPSASSRRVEWHRAAHAIVSLATVAPEAAQSRMAAFVRHPVWQVRVYAARAAVAIKDADTLRALANDSSDNVRATVITGLGRVTEHGDDKIFIASLTRTEHAVIQAAARALQGSPNRAEAVTALVGALQRLSALKKDNTRDPRVAILQRLQELGSADQAAHLKPLLADFDPRVATVAAETLTKWTGVAHTAAPVRPPTHAPRFADVMGLQSTPVRITMRTGGAFELRLYPEEAPATVERFVRLARTGYYNGLTFHRVAPNWVIQGGSPGANEFSGDSPFMIDEMGMRSHTRGTLGISTRGRDTGDAQIFVNLGDNPSLDHAFTVWGEVVQGMETVDAVVEGDVIDKIEVGPPSSM
jgi:cyclophilin family peptidyl-prolyl cis-trans isomerase/HEAT repeat protein